MPEPPVPEKPQAVKEAAAEAPKPAADINIQQAAEPGAPEQPVQIKEDKPAQIEEPVSEIKKQNEERRYTEKKLLTVTAPQKAAADNNKEGIREALPEIGAAAPK